ncbi:MAG TPA: hypothetical protein VI588_04175 [Candidatus Gracilibacteria bacterium]|nr:hypothetical protein [Candidatus Gracilibacteria bacterium]
MKNITAKLGLLILTGLMTATPVANAGYYNFGTLDVRPVTTDAAQNSDWFIEYLAPGSRKQQQIQISNFSPETKNLTVYAADTDTNEGETFFAKSVEQNSEDISGWIDLPANRLILDPGESKILSVNFRLPENAGVGLHTGAIIVRENKTQSEGPLKTVAIEKGVRVYLNVTGPAITQSRVSGISASSAFNAQSFSIETTNTGTTDIRSAYAFELRDLSGNTAVQTQGETLTKPATAETLTLTTEAPKFGLYQAYISNGSETTFIGSTMSVPVWALFLIAGFSLAAGMMRAPKRARRATPSFAETADRILSTFRQSLSSLELRRSAAYFGMLTVAAISTLAISEFDPDLAKSQLLTTGPAASYELTVKWGNFRNMTLPEYYRKQWHGRVFFPNAKVTTMKLLHFERNDEGEIVGDNTALRFNALTGPDNDGLVLHVVPTDNEIPVVRYENFDNDETYEFLITDYLGAQGVYPDGLFSTSFKTDLGEEEQHRIQALEDAMEELGATAEVEATPPPVAQIPELENLFIEDLPATPEVLTDFVLTSDYVEEIVRQNSTARVETDSILIEALEATPEVLQEIAATPDLNFVFIPSETINFPPQAFSFDEQMTAEQDLGTLIFVQNKETPWNTYISTTDFSLLSGGSVIPASAITIIPGEAVLLTNDGAKIETGGTEIFQNEQDKNSLVSVDSGAGDNEIFAMRPKLEVRIPAGTPAGTYQGSLTITSL